MTAINACPVAAERHQRVGFLSLLLAFGLAGLLAASCGELLPPSSELNSFRVLTATATPPQQFCGQKVALSALVVDEDGFPATDADILWFLLKGDVNVSQPTPQQLINGVMLTGRDVVVAIPDEDADRCSAGGSLVMVLLAVKDLDWTAVSDPQKAGDYFAELLKQYKGRLVLRSITVLPSDHPDPINANPVISAVSVELPDGSAYAPTLTDFPDRTATDDSVVNIPYPGREKHPWTLSLRAYVADDDTKDTTNLTIRWYSTAAFKLYNTDSIDWEARGWRPADDLTADDPNPNRYPVYIVVWDKDNGISWKSFVVRMCGPDDDC